MLIFELFTHYLCRDPLAQLDLLERTVPMECPALSDPLDLVDVLARLVPP